MCDVRGGARQGGHPPASHIPNGQGVVEDIALGDLGLAHGAAEEARLALPGVADGRRPRVAEGVDRAQVPHPHLLQFPVFIPVELVAAGVGVVPVQGAAVEADQAPEETGLPHPPLDLQGADPGVDHLRQERQQADVLDCQEVGPRVSGVLAGRCFGAAGGQHRPGLPVDQFEWPAAGLQAAATVAALAEQHPAEVALAALGEAHVPMGEVLQFQVGLAVPQLDVGQGDLPGQDHPPDSQVFQKLQTLQVVGVHHHAGMEGHPEVQVVGKLDHSQVLGNDPVGGDLLQKLQVFAQVVDLGVGQQVVDSDVDLD